MVSCCLFIEELVQTYVKNVLWKTLSWTRQLACGRSLWKMTQRSVLEWVTGVGLAVLTAYRQMLTVICRKMAALEAAV